MCALNPSTLIAVVFFFYQKCQLIFGSQIPTCISVKKSQFLAFLNVWFVGKHSRLVLYVYQAL